LKALITFSISLGVDGSLRILGQLFEITLCINGKNSAAIELPCLPLSVFIHLLPVEMKYH
jgi:hypothetical protein